jgi:hypothetical protein
VKVLETVEGYNELLKQLTPSMQSAPVYAFLSTITRDYSSLDVSIKLLSVALNNDPSKASYALNLAHLYENKYELVEALNSITAFCYRNRSHRVGVNGFTAEELGALITAIIDASETLHSDANLDLCSIHWDSANDCATVVQMTGDINASTYQTTSNGNQNEALE